VVRISEKWGKGLFEPEGEEMQIPLLLGRRYEVAVFRVGEKWFFDS
jgi:hypothetical protein